MPEFDTTLVERVRELLPTIAARADEAQKLRRIPDITIEELREIGFFRGYVPAKFGGLELSPYEMAQAARLLGTACMSTAWVAQLLAVHSHSLANYSTQLQEEIWGATGPDTLISSSVAPVGRCVEDDSGVRLSGRYAWSSGCEHASWAILGFVRNNAAGDPEPHFAVVPRTDYTIEDTWHSMGLCGTGSQDIVIDDVFVPNHRIESVLGMNVGMSQGFGTHPAPVYAIPFMTVFTIGFSAVGLGAAESLVDLYRERLSNRVRAYTGAKVAESTPALVRLAESTHELHAASRLLEHDWKEMITRAEAPDPINMEDLTNWRGHQAYAVRLAVRAADRLFEASGGGAVRNESAMQRIWRDIHTGAAHAYSDYDVAASSAGAFLAGVEPPAGTF